MKATTVLVTGVSFTILVTSGIDSTVLASSAEPSTSVAREKRLDRGRREIGRFRSELKRLMAYGADEMADLERRLDTMEPLESPRRERTLRDLSSAYADWRERLADLDADAGREEADPAKAGPVGAYLADSWDGAARVARDFADRLNRDARANERELHRLNILLERRRVLEERLADLRERLGRIDEDIDEGKRKGGGAKGERGEQVRVRIRQVQDDLRSLADVDEGLLKHLAVMVEQEQLEQEWQQLAAERFDEFRKVSASGRGGLTERLGRLVRLLERQASQMTRLGNSLDRREERISSVGSVRELDRSRELRDLYDRYQTRYRTESERLGTLAGSYKADLAGMQGKGGIQHEAED